MSYFSISKAVLVVVHKRTSRNVGLHYSVWHLALGNKCSICVVVLDVPQNLQKKQSPHHDNIDYYVTINLQYTFVVVAVLWT